jgi:hypothetical protein
MLTDRPDQLIEITPEEFTRLSDPPKVAIAGYLIPKYNSLLIGEEIEFRRLLGQVNINSADLSEQIQTKVAIVQILLRYRCGLWFEDLEQDTIETNHGFVSLTTRAINELYKFFLAEHQRGNAEITDGAANPESSEDSEVQPGKHQPGEKSTGDLSPTTGKGFQSARGSSATRSRRRSPPIAPPSNESTEQPA